MQLLLNVAGGTEHVVFVIVKSPGLPPARATELMFTGDVPVLVTVMTCDALVVPTAVPGKLRVLGVNVSVFTVAMPLPFSVTVCGLPAPSLATERVAVRAPAV
jgi:hypothetical protein